VKAEELRKIEAECKEIDQRHKMESSRPGGPDLRLRPGTQMMADYERREAADKKLFQKRDVLRGTKTQAQVDKENELEAKETLFAKESRRLAEGRRLD
jgi:hypothetical protein